MLKEFCMLVRTLKRMIPAMERGILFKEPTRLYYKQHWHQKSRKQMTTERTSSNVLDESNGGPLWIRSLSWKSFLWKHIWVHMYILNIKCIRYLYVVALVWWRNHMEVKLIPSPKTPLAVMTSQNSGILKRGLQIQLQIHNHKMEEWTCKYSEEAYLME